MRHARYTPSEVKGLIEGYQALREAKSTYGPGLLILAKLTDLDQAIKRMPPKEYHAVLLHGLLDVSGAESHLGYSVRTLYYRYEAGVQWITDYLNGKES